MSVGLLWFAHSAAAADGSGSNTVSPTTVTASTTGNILTFTFTAAEAMNSGEISLAVPIGWSAPTGTAGVPGYTVASSGAGIIASVLDNADSTSSWSAGTACSNGLNATTTVKLEGTASIVCRNGDETSGDVWYKNIASQDWSTYTKVGFWIRTSSAVSANRLRFAYDNDANLASPIASLNLPAISANTWTYVTLTLSGTRNSVVSFGFVINHNSALDGVNIFVDDLLIGPGRATFPGADLIKVEFLSLSAGQTAFITYGSGGGASGAISPPTPRTSVFTTQSRTSVSGMFTDLGTSPSVSVESPLPTLASISPSTKYVGDSTFDLTLTGTNFLASSTAAFAGSPLVTTYIGSTQLSASVPATKLTTAGTFNITVNNPTPGGGTSTARVLTIDNPTPTLSTVAPSSAIVGDADTPITLTGTGFVANSVARFNGANLVTTYVSSTQLTATIASSSLLLAGYASVTVNNPTPGGGTSGAQTFTVNNAVPTISSISPDSVEVGGPDFTLEVNGTGYATTSVMEIDGTPLTTTYINPRHLQATIGSAYIATTGTPAITVFSPLPGGGTSTPSVLNVVDTTPPAITITAPTKISQNTITDTTIRVTDLDIHAAKVTVDPSSTAGTANLNCTQTSSTQVDCTIDITASGYLVIKAIDENGVSNTQTMTGYRVDTVPPSITITAPTTASSSTITDTTIHVADQPFLNAGVLAADVIVDPSTTAGTAAFSCSQTDTSTVDCIVHITSNGNLVIKATDKATNSATSSHIGYVVDTVPPVIAITAPTKVSSLHITDTTVHVTDDNGLTASDVSVDASSTANVVAFHCDQTDPKTADCTVDIHGSGDLVIRAVDALGNSSTQSETGYVIDDTDPVISITAPTKFSGSTITDTTIHVTDNYALTAANVIVDPSTTAGTSSFSCSQTNGTTVDCTINITSSGNLVIKATDDVSNFSQQGENDYVVDKTRPTIAITAPTMASSTAITNTTIHVTDDYALTAANVIVDPSTTAGTSSFSCSQTNGTIVDCTIGITSSGNLVIEAIDDALNTATDTLAGYVIETVPPVIAITAPTTSSTSDITDTTIHVTDNHGINYGSVVIDPSTTAVAHNWSCSQTDSKTVDCTIEISGSGDLTIRATDLAHNSATQTQAGYTVNHIGPTIAITAPTKLSHTTITDTTIHVTDATAVSSTDVIVDPSTTAGTSNFSCSQTDSKTVDCTIRITSSGNLVMKATNSAANSTLEPENNYIIETVPPTIAFTAPTKVSTSAITDTTIHVTDNQGIQSTAVTVSPTSGADTSDFICSQTDSKTVDCAIHVDSSGDVTIDAQDEAGNTASLTESGYFVETTAPVFSSISAAPSDHAATVTWTTDQLATSRAIYSPDASYASSTSIYDTSPRVVSHSVTVSNLVSCATYHYKVVSSDTAGNAATSTDNIFTTTGCVGNAAVLSQNSQTLATTGGTLSLTQGTQTLTLHAPNGYNSSPANFQIKALGSAVVLGSTGSPNGRHIVGSAVFDLSALLDSQTLLSSFTGPITVTLTYTAGDISGLDEHSLVIYHYTGGSWIPLSSCSVNTGARTVTCTTDSFSVFGLFGSASTVTPTSGSGGNSMDFTPASGPVVGGVASALDFSIDGGSGTTQQRIVTLSLKADSSTVRGYAVSLDPNLKDSALLAFATEVTFTLPDVAGSYTVYVRYYSRSGLPSAIISHTIVYQPSGTAALSPTDLVALLGSQNMARDAAAEALAKQQALADAKEFGLQLSDDQLQAIVNFIAYGNSAATIKFGSGERRAIIRDYFDTVRRADVVWSDVERLATGQIPVARNLTIERKNVTVVLPVFRNFFGHDPDFKNATENLAWNTMMYRIRFSRDLKAEAAGLDSYRASYRHNPISPFSWSIVRMLGYVK